MESLNATLLPIVQTINGYLAVKLFNWQEVEKRIIQNA